mmetsp:Transcript_56221/g.164278  ORF Transcript_56221/g.164278 Transcript_56221/m.164278 type:complete len:211 (+) Transcript_56221:1300-1932(+)
MTGLLVSLLPRRWEWWTKAPRRAPQPQPTGPRGAISPKPPVAQRRGCGSRATPATWATARRCLIMRSTAFRCACPGSLGASVSDNARTAAPWTLQLAHASAVAIIGTDGLARTAARLMARANPAPVPETGALPPDAPLQTGARRGTTQSSALLPTSVVQLTLAPSAAPSAGLAPVVPASALVCEQAAREMKHRPRTKLLRLLPYWRVRPR